MIKTVLKIDGMMCGMCESHMNDVVRKSCSPKKVNSSAKSGETVVISEAPLDIPYLKQQLRKGCNTNYDRKWIDGWYKNRKTVLQ